jgi:transmembrane protein 33
MAASSATSRAPSGSNQPLQTLQHRLEAVVRHQQFLWWVGHVIIVISTFIHFIYWLRFNYDNGVALFFYRLALAGPIGSYGVVVHKMFFRVQTL